MIVTINTDASYSLKYRAGAYAFWIVCNEGKICASGALKKKIKTSHEAEAQCILNAIHVVTQQQYKTPITKIIVNTDSNTAIFIFTQEKKRNIKWMLDYGNALWESFNMFKKKLKIPIEFRVVKAHREVTDAKSWVNDWCDKNAKAQLGIYLGSLKK